MSIRDRFWQLCEEAYRLDQQYPLDVRAFEPAMVEMIRLVQRHPEERELFVASFSALVRGDRKSPDELVAFCMRTLRFSEIRQFVLDEAAQHLGTAHWARHCTYWSDILHAFDDEEWPQADLWDHYTHERPSADPVTNDPAIESSRDALQIEPPGS